MVTEVAAISSMPSPLTSPMIATLKPIAESVAGLSVFCGPLMVITSLLSAIVVPLVPPCVPPGMICISPVTLNTQPCVGVESS